MILTLRYRVKDSTACRRLNAHARAVNFVWNYLTETQRRRDAHWRGGAHPRWLTWQAFDRLTTGTSTDLNIDSGTIAMACRQFCASRERNRRCPRFRASNGPKRALGWIPFRDQNIKIEGDRVRYRKRWYRIWLSRPIAGRVRSGSFSQDARGRWYVNLQVETDQIASDVNGEVGIDLGLKALATLSTGETVANPRHFQRHAQALAVAQRGRNEARVRAIHAKIANCRKHHLHQISTQLARSNRRIVVGNISASKLAKTRFAKSVLDSGWSSFRSMLAYKSAIRLGHQYIEVDEAFTTRACSCCGVIPDSSPKGIGALGMRTWVCNACGASHDRDVNAARNILRLGAKCCPPAGETGLTEGIDSRTRSEALKRGGK